jgi:hypothetical protein
MVGAHLSDYAEGDGENDLTGTEGSIGDVWLRPENKISGRFRASLSGIASHASHARMRCMERKSYARLRRYGRRSSGSEWRQRRRDVLIGNEFKLRFLLKLLRLELGHGGGGWRDRRRLGALGGGDLGGFCRVFFRRGRRDIILAATPPAVAVIGVVPAMLGGTMISQPPGTSSLSAISGAGGSEAGVRLRLSAPPR